MGSVGRLAVVTGSLATLLGACGGDAGERPNALADGSVTVASFAFPESVLLAELYSQVIEGQGVAVERAFGLGPRELVGPAMKAGLVELVPEYAGTALTFVTAGAVEPGPDPRATHDALRDALAGTEVEALAPAPAQDANTFVVTSSTARHHELDALSDLAPLAGALTFGGPPECRSRPLCLRGLDERYGLRFGEVVVLDAGGPLTHQALRAGDVDVALLFTTDPSLDRYVELADDRRLQPAENVTPLVRREVLEAHGRELAEAIDAVSARLDTAALRELNRLDALAPGAGDVPYIVATWLDSVAGS